MLVERLMDRAATDDRRFKKRLDGKMWRRKRHRAGRREDRLQGRDGVCIVERCTAMVLRLEPMKIGVAVHHHVMTPGAILAVVCVLGRQDREEPHRASEQSGRHSPKR